MAPRGVTICCLVFISLCSASEPEWYAMGGSTMNDVAEATDVDTGHSVYVVGHTSGDLYGTSQGWKDAFVVKYSGSGSLDWSKQVGTAENDAFYGVSADGSSGAYVVGSTRGDNWNTNDAKNRDVLVQYYSSGGSLKWTFQSGYANGDEATCVATSTAGGALVGGNTNGVVTGTNAGGVDAFVLSISDGTVSWTAQKGSAGDDYVTSIAALSNGGAAVCGYTNDAMTGASNGGFDAYAMTYTSSGTLSWVVQIGSSTSDYCHAVSVDSAGDIIIAGSTAGDLSGTNAGGYDYFVAKLASADGSQTWLIQGGTSSFDQARGVAVSPSNEILVVAWTGGAISGTNSDGNYDVATITLSSAGTQQSSFQLDVSAGTLATPLSASYDSEGELTVVGSTSGSVSGKTNNGAIDFFVVSWLTYTEGVNVTLIVLCVILPLLCCCCVIFVHFALTGYFAAAVFVWVKISEKKSIDSVATGKEGKEPSKKAAKAGQNADGVDIEAGVAAKYAPPKLAQEPSQDGDSGAPSAPPLIAGKVSNSSSRETSKGSVSEPEEPRHKVRLSPEMVSHDKLHNILEDDGDALRLFLSGKITTENIGDLDSDKKLRHVGIKSPEARKHILSALDALIEESDAKPEVTETRAQSLPPGDDASSASSSEVQKPLRKSSKDVSPEEVLDIELGLAPPVEVVYDGDDDGAKKGTKEIIDKSKLGKLPSFSSREEALKAASKISSQRNLLGNKDENDTPKKKNAPKSFEEIKARVKRRTSVDSVSSDVGSKVVDSSPELTSASPSPTPEARKLPSYSSREEAVEAASKISSQRNHLVNKDENDSSKKKNAPKSFEEIKARVKRRTSVDSVSEVKPKVVDSSPEVTSASLSPPPVMKSPEVVKKPEQRGGVGVSGQKPESFEDIKARVMGRKAKKSPVPSPEGSPDLTSSTKVLKNSSKKDPTPERENIRVALENLKKMRGSPGSAASSASNSPALAPRP